MKEGISVVLLHDHPEYLELCAVLLNKEWKRSLSARIQSLENSSEDLPDSLLLLEEQDGKKIVIGHSRLTRVLENSNGCWIGSVLIDEDRRGKGYGKYLMDKTEEYAKHLNFTYAYLSTQDQQGFYERLGYSAGESVSSISFKNGMAVIRSIFKSQMNASSIFKENDRPNKDKESGPTSNDSNSSISALKGNIEQCWMKKLL